MGVARNSSRYPVERAIFEQALRMGGLDYTLPTPGQATNFRQRAYYFRTLLFKEMNLGGGSAVIPTPFDSMKLIIRPEAPCVVQFRIDVPVGVITPINDAVVSAEDEQLAAAIELRKKLFGEIK